MPFVVTPYVIWHAVAGVVALSVAVVAWRRRHLVGARSIAAMLAAVGWWGLVGSVELAAVGVEAKVFWSKVTYPGTLFSPILLLVFALELRQSAPSLRPGRVAALFIVPCLTLLLAFTNERHGLIWSSFSEGPPGSNLLVYGHGAGFWWGAVAYSYLCIAVATLLLIEITLRFAELHRWRMAVVLLAIALPWLGNFLYIAKLSPWPVDLAPFAMGASGAIFLWMLVGSRLPEFLPLARLRLIERLPDAVLVFDSADRLVELNPAAQRWLEAEGRWPAQNTLARLLPPRPEWQAVAAGAGEGRFEIEADRPEGRSFQAELLELTNAAGRRAGRLLIVSDTTERKRAEAARLALERRALWAEKHESLGLFAAGIAHDFNNLMMSVLGRLAYAKQKLPAGEPMIAELAEAERAGQRVAELTRQILLYAGTGFGAQTGLELAAVVRGAVQEVRRTAPASVALSLEAAAGLPLIQGNAAQLGLLCANLFANAVEAIGSQPGSIAVRVWAEAQGFVAEPPLKWELHGAEGRPHVALEICDTGCGMDAETQARMFEPFFTTRFFGRGLGLAAVWGIVRSHEGAIGVASAPGLGTRVRVIFPTGAA